MASPIKPSLFSKDLINFLRTRYHEIEKMEDEVLCTTYSCHLVIRNGSMLGVSSALSVIVEQYCISVGKRVTPSPIPVFKFYDEKFPNCRSIIERRRGFVAFALKYLDWMESEYYSAECE